MTSLLLKTILTQFLFTLTLVACGQTSNSKHLEKTKSKIERNLQVDTSKTAIIPLAKTGSYPFGDAFKHATLTQTDLVIIDSMINQSVMEYNNSLKPQYKQFGIDLNNGNYKKQLVAATNSKGEKEVWVNCFCRTSDNRWKTEIMYVDDGGNCYFKLKINLTKKAYYEFAVNGRG